MENALVIPSYEPTLRLIEVLDGVLSRGEFDHVYVVDDGSGEKYAPLFAEIKKKERVSVLSYMPNRGKGAALKTAFFDITLHHPGVGYIVTADGDGQHLVEDIVRVSEAAKMAPASLVMGTRDFVSESVPFNSKWGNRISCLYYRLATRQRISDTQTGLRAIPKSLFPLALETRGDRYDYEMNFLLSASKAASVISIPIKTVYEERNKCSHFRPIRDSFLIYKTPALYCLVALLSALIDYGLFYALDASLSFPLLGKIGLATIIARIISGTFNFALLNSIVFPSGKDLGGRTLRYLILFLINMSLSFGLVYLLALLSPLSAAILKIFVEIMIFILDFGLNSFVVFASKRPHNHLRAKEGGTCQKK